MHAASQEDHILSKPSRSGNQGCTCRLVLLSTVVACVRKCHPSPCFGRRLRSSARHGAASGLAHGAQGLAAALRQNRRRRHDGGDLGCPSLPRSCLRSSELRTRIRPRALARTIVNVLCMEWVHVSCKQRIIPMHMPCCLAGNTPTAQAHSL